MFHKRERDRESISGSFCREPIHDANMQERALVSLCHSVVMRRDPALVEFCLCLYLFFPQQMNLRTLVDWLNCWHFTLLKWWESSFQGRKGHGALASSVDSSATSEHLHFVSSELGAEDAAAGELVAPGSGCDGEVQTVIQWVNKQETCQEAIHAMQIIKAGWCDGVWLGIMSSWKLRWCLS